MVQYTCSQNILNSWNYIIFFPGTCFEDGSLYICAHNLLNIHENCRYKQNHICRYCVIKIERWKQSEAQMQAEILWQLQNKVKESQAINCLCFCHTLLKWAGCCHFSADWFVQGVDLRQKYPKKAHESSTTVHCRRGAGPEGRKESKVSETRPWRCTMTLLRYVVSMLICPISWGQAWDKAGGMKEAGILYKPRKRKGDV